MNPLGKPTYDDARMDVVSLGVDLSHRGRTFNRHSPKRVDVGSNRFLEFASESIKLDSCARYLKSAMLRDSSSKSLCRIAMLRHGLLFCAKTV